MARCNELSECDRKAIEILSKEGKSVRQIAEQLGKPKSTVHYTISRLKKYGTLKSLPRSGRRRKTTVRVDRKIVNLDENSVSPNAIEIANKLAEMNIADVCPQTVRNLLHGSSLFGRSSIRKPCQRNI